MKKTHFIEFYKSTVNAFILAIIFKFINLITVFCSIALRYPKIKILQESSSYFYIFGTFANFIFILLLFYAITIIMIEICLRIVSGDNIFNILNSIIKTHNLQMFLHQKDKNYNTVIQSVSSDPINKEFNHAVRKSVIDISDKNVIVSIALPRSQQARKVFENISLKEYISNDIPNCSFSNGQYSQKRFWFIGNINK